MGAGFLLLVDGDDTLGLFILMKARRLEVSVVWIKRRLAGRRFFLCHFGFLLLVEDDATVGPVQQWTPEEE